MAQEKARKYVFKKHPAACFKIKMKGPDVNRPPAMIHMIEGAFNAVPHMEQNKNDWGNKAV